MYSFENGRNYLFGKLEQTVPEIIEDFPYDDYVDDECMQNYEYYSTDNHVEFMGDTPAGFCVNPICKINHTKACLVWSKFNCEDCLAKKILIHRQWVKGIPIKLLIERFEKKSVIPCIEIGLRFDQGLLHLIKKNSRGEFEIITKTSNFEIVNDELKDPVVIINERIKVGCKIWGGEINAYLLGNPICANEWRNGCPYGNYPTWKEIEYGVNTGALKSNKFCYECIVDYKKANMTEEELNDTPYLIKKIKDLKKKSDSDKKIIDYYEDQMLDMKLEIDQNNIIISEMMEELNLKKDLIETLSEKEMIIKSQAKSIREMKHQIEVLCTLIKNQN